MNELRVAEAVGRGHPDRIADQIADKVVDLVLAKDPKASVGVEVLISKEGVVIAGEIDTAEMPDLSRGVKEALAEAGISPTLPLQFSLHRPSSEIISTAERGLFGDQSIATGYATKEHPSFLPLPQALAKEAVSLLESVPGLGKDGKLLVFIEGREKPRIRELRISWQLGSSPPLIEDLRSVFFKQFPYLDSSSLIVIHPFFSGGLDADTGSSGRKVISESYGPEIPHGGGALSGKDGSKVDRLGAYVARLIALSHVKEKGAAFAFVTLTSFFGDKRFHSLSIKTDKEQIETTLSLTKEELVSLLTLQRPIYYETAVKGHFCKDYPWEKLILLP